MDKIRVAGAQMPVTPDIESNVSYIEQGIDFAAKERAQILLTPEGSLSGYTPEFDVHALQDALERVTAKAKQAKVGLALGTCFVEPHDERRYNQIRFYTPDGAFIGFHSKTLRCGSLGNPPEGEINHYAAMPLRVYSFLGVPVGGLICNDMWANPCCTPMPDPHLSQILSEMDARIIFHAVNGGRDGGYWSDVAWKYHECNLLMRASAGGLWVVVADSCQPTDIRCSCPSGVINPKGRWVCRTEPMGVQFFVHTIDLTEEDDEE